MGWLKGKSIEIGTYHIKKSLERGVRVQMFESLAYRLAIRVGNALEVSPFYTGFAYLEIWIINGHE